VSWSTVLMDGLAQHLENQDVGTFHSTGVGYTTAQVGIVFDVVPANPDRVIVLSLYDERGEPTQGDVDVYVQVRVRGDRDPRTALALDDAVYDAWQNLPRSLLGGTVVAGIFRESRAYMGVDANGRHERSSNYRIPTHHPTAHLV
jgi:hypothetical protein